VFWTAREEEEKKKKKKKMQKISSLLPFSVPSNKRIIINNNINLHNFGDQNIA